MSSYCRLLAGDKAEVLKDLHDGQLHHQESKSHANAVPRPCSEGQEAIRIYVVFVFFAEPEKKMNKYFKSITKSELNLTLTVPRIQQSTFQVWRRPAQATKQGHVGGCKQVSWWQFL